MIFQDLPDSSVGVPLEALVHKEGRITAERQVEGPRKGQWLFNRATVRSVDRLYDAFESKPIVPELAAAGRAAGGPAFRLEPGLWLRHRLPGWLRYRIELQRSALASPCISSSGWSCSCSWSCPLYRLVVWPAHRAGHGPDALEEVSRSTIERSAPGSARSAGWPRLDARRGRDAPRLADGGRGRPPGRPGPGLLARGGPGRLPD